MESVTLCVCALYSLRALQLLGSINAWSKIQMLRRSVRARGTETAQTSVHHFVNRICGSGFPRKSIKIEHDKKTTTKT